MRFDWLADWLDNWRHVTGSRVYAEVFSGCQARTTHAAKSFVVADAGHGCLLTPVTEQRHGAPKCQQLTATAAAAAVAR